MVSKAPLIYSTHQHMLLLAEKVEINSIADTQLMVTGHC